MIITNREEVIDKAFGVFVRMNYEKASIITLAKACGVTKRVSFIIFRTSWIYSWLWRTNTCCKCTNRKTSLPLLPIR